MERNLLISRPDNRTYVDENGNFRPAFHIIERDSYTPIEDGYQDTVFVRETDEAGILERVQAAARDLLAGRRVVEISRVTVRGDQVSITYAGVARASTTGRGVVMHIAGARYTSPLSQVRAVVAGTRTAALVSQMVDEAVIDADEAQAQQGGRRIDEGLAHSFA